MCKCAILCQPPGWARIGPPLLRSNRCPPICRMKKWQTKICETCISLVYITISKHWLIMFTSKSCSLSHLTSQPVSLRVCVCVCVPLVLRQHRHSTAVNISQCWLVEKKQLTTCWLIHGKLNQRGVLWVQFIWQKLHHFTVLQCNPKLMSC